MAHNSINIANQFLLLAKREGRKISPMMLQKLVYCAHGWNLAIYIEPLITEKVEAWSYGPVIPSIYHAFKVFGSAPIEPDIVLRESLQPSDNVHIDPMTEELLKKVWEVYGQYTAIQLSNMTHQKDTPWYNTWRSGISRHTPIDNELIKSHFVQLAKRN